MAPKPFSATEAARCLGIPACLASRVPASSGMARPPASLREAWRAGAAGGSRIAAYKKIRRKRLPAVMVAGGYAVTRAALVLEKKLMQRRDEKRAARRKGRALAKAWSAQLNCI